MQFIVLSSSRGTTFQAVIDAMKKGDLTAKCLGLITDRADRGCIEKATAAGIPYRVVEKDDHESREDYDKRLHKTIGELSGMNEKNSPASALATAGKQFSILNSQFCVAALGWMFILTPWFVKRWNVINVHPALLPKFGGKGMYGTKVHDAVLAAGEHESGITIHLMDEGVDTGKILLQKTCPVEPDDTVDSLRERVQALERQWYPVVLQMIEKGELEL